jgi:hypothetical protein
MTRGVRRSTVDSFQSFQFGNEAYSQPVSPKSPARIYRLEGINGGSTEVFDETSELENEEESIDPSMVKQEPDPSLHLFSIRKKKAIIHLMAVAALFSPLSSNIYFPAIESIAKANLAFPKRFKQDLTILTHRTGITHFHCHGPDDHQLLHDFSRPCTFFLGRERSP